MDALGLGMVVLIPMGIGLALALGWGGTILLLLFKRTRAFALSVSLTGVVSALYCLLFSLLVSATGLGRNVAGPVPFQVIGSSGLALALGFGVGASAALLLGFPFYLGYSLLSKPSPKEPNVGG